MSDTLIATLGGVVALVFWGTGDWLMARNSKELNPLDVNLSVQVPGFIITVAAMILTSQAPPSFDHTIILAIAGAIFAIAFIVFVKALSIGNVGVVVPLSAIFPLITIVLIALFLTLNFSAIQVMAMVIIVAGSILLAFEKRNKAISLKAQHQASFLALAAAFLWGLGNFVQNIVIGKESWLTILALLNVFMSITFIFVVIFTSAGAMVGKVRQALHNKVGLIAGAILTTGSFGFYIGADRIKSVLVPAVIGSAAPLVTSFLSAAIDKEKLTVIKRAGAVIVVAGIIMLNIF